MANALDTLHIYGITVDISKSKTNIESAEVRIGKSHSPIELKREEPEGRSLRHTFSLPKVFSRDELFSLHMRHKNHFLRTKHHNDVTFDTDEIFRAYGASQREYIKWYKKIRIVVDFSENTSTKAASSGQSSGLSPTTSDIFERCPQFRILVIGKTGVGKSSLIDHVFGVGKRTVSKTIVEHDRPGEACIDDEFTSRENDRFVLHNSKGFEPGEEKNLKIVQDFMERRKNMPDLKDQLHAVWLCIQIPRAGGRLLETGTEDFLKSKLEGTLGNVPVIVVLTKYDILVDRVERTLNEASLDGLSEKAIQELVKEGAETEVQNTCIGPLEEFTGSDIPYATISTAKGYKETLTGLIQKTETCVNLHLEPDAAVMTSVAQRVHPGLKIKALIKIGKQRYWNALMSCPTFKNNQMKDCLRVLHNDIVDVWNFRDPHKYLRSQQFRDLMMTMVDNIQAESTTTSMTFGSPDHRSTNRSSRRIRRTMGHRHFFFSDVVLQRLMAYIMHLTLVLQTRFFVSKSRVLTHRAIKLAVKSYLASPIREEVLTRIQDYVQGLAILAHADKDILDKIEEMMQFYEMDAAQVSELEAKIPDVDLLPDEPW
ncbi:uncharacterized protein F5891DRAFT_1193554 [Suillus fuscotomentosus]|uniref:G domain-containing protein n=1 Tax=Suillus fuscotomentosus TaxID=1912939 RepID=A0AAD4DXI4_9AGAM|nr:uncharacterized protein F5891DRAFT_1193554 [Suillus fuscotomentosus]KAG1895941.1 hypothetical protein F5891DRAFT_1193554 [Suillus fuscotomentosus]